MEVIRSFLKDLRGWRKHLFFEKKAILSVKKKFWSNFSRFIECDKPHVTIYKGPKCRLTVNLEDKRSFLYNIGCWKQKILKNRATFPAKKLFWPILSRIIEHGKHQGTTNEGPKGNLTLTVEVIRSFLKDLRGWRKHLFFEKKAILSVKKKFWSNFSRFIECDKPHVTIYKGPKCRMTLCLEDIRSFLYNIGCWKQKNLKKKATFPAKKNFFGLFFLALSNRTNVREQLKRVQKVIWHLLWKL